MVIESANLTW